MEKKDLYNHIQKFKNKFEEFKVSKKLSIGTKDSKRSVKLNLNNRDLVVKWIEHKQKELENQNGVDINAQIKYFNTLYKELTTYLMNTLFWFNFKNFQDLDEQDIDKIYRCIEDGTLKSIKNRKRLSESSRNDIYSRVFKSGFFKFIGKDTISKKIIKRKFSLPSDVRFFRIETLKKIADNSAKNVHRLAFWLLFDTGAEIMAVCQLKKKHFELIQEENSEYFMLHIPLDISKKTRKKRHIYIHFDETNQLLENHLSALNDEDDLFKFKPAALYHELKKVVDKYELKTIPNKTLITIKDFRSSMATYFLSNDYGPDFVKARLGHSPSSSEIDKYVSYLDLQGKKQKKKQIATDYKALQEEVKKLREQIRSEAQDKRVVEETLVRVVDALEDQLNVYFDKWDKVDLNKLRDKYYKPYKVLPKDTILKKS